MGEAGCKRDVGKAGAFRRRDAAAPVYRRVDPGGFYRARSAGGPAAEARPGGGATAVSGPVFAWILLDAETGQVLGEQNADVLTYPASLTKMMTLYLTFEALNQGRIRLDQLFTVSAGAASRSPSKLGLTPGETVPLRDLILGVVTRSANDAASVIAENLAGSEANFARYMTWKARQLGMQHTWYQNASGLPDPAQRTTARDVARLSLALYHDFPREYRYFSTQEFYFRGEEINTHNHLLEWYPGRRRHQDRLRQRVGFQYRDLGGAQRAPTDRGDHGRPVGAQPRPADGLAARPGLRGARKPPAGGAVGRGGSGRQPIRRRPPPTRSRRSAAAARRHRARAAPAPACGRTGP